MSWLQTHSAHRTAMVRRPHIVPQPKATWMCCGAFISWLQTPSAHRTAMVTRLHMVPQPEVTRMRCGSFMSWLQTHSAHRTAMAACQHICRSRRSPECAACLRQLVPDTLSAQENIGGTPAHLAAARGHVNELQLPSSAGSRHTQRTGKYGVRQHILPHSEAT